MLKPISYNDFLRQMINSKLKEVISEDMRTITNDHGEPIGSEVEKDDLDRMMDQGSDDYDYGDMNSSSDSISFNPEEPEQVSELYTLLAFDGCDIREDYPSWVFEVLEDYIMEDHNTYSWFFNEDGKVEFTSPEIFANFIKSAANDYFNSSSNDSESPYLRGYEP